ncbi:MAG: amino acid ABC transporter substrate-binding protein, partial [Candidatus Entotheonellia bacterium]
YVPELQHSVPLRLLASDDHSRRAEVESLVERLITQEHVDFLIGPYGSGLAWAGARIAEAHSKLLWNHGGSSDAILGQGFRWVVTLPTPASRYFAGVFPCLSAYTSSGDCVAIVQRSQGTFAAAVALGGCQEAEAHGFKTLPPFFYPDTPDRFPSLVQDLTAAKPALILGVGRYRDDVHLVRALAEAGLDVDALVLVATPMHAFREDLGELAEGCIGPSQWEPHAQGRPDVGPTSTEFVERFRRRFGETPDYPSAQAYAAGLVLQQCVGLAETCTDAALREVAYRLDCQTFYGRFRMHPTTGVQQGHEMVLVQWQAGIKRLIWPTTIADAPPLYPKAAAKSLPPSSPSPS